MQSTLSFTSRKALPPTPDKKRKIQAPDTATVPLSPPPTPAFVRKAKVEPEAVKSGPSATNDPLSVPAEWKPLGNETEAMIANLKGGSFDQVDDDESDAEDSDDMSGPLRSHQSSGIRPRKAMLRATDEISKARSTSASSAKSKGKGKAPAMEFGGKLDPKDKKWQAIYAKTSEAMGGDECPPVHCTPKSHTRVHRKSWVSLLANLSLTTGAADILRVFDLTPDYGPCVGVTRLQRWERAQEWGLEPPKEVRHACQAVCVHR